MANRIIDIMTKKLISEKLDSESNEDFRNRISEKYMDKVLNKVRNFGK